MLKKTLISFFIFISLALVSLSIIFVYSEQSRNFIISKLNITQFIKKKLENYLSNKINNDDIAIQIENIEFLKPKLPNIIHLRLNNIDINSITNNSNSEIGFVEIGFNYKSLIKNIFSDDGIYFDNLNFKNLTLNAQFQKDKITLGPLIKIFSVANQNDVNKNKSIANILEKEITVGNIQLKISDNRNPIKELIYVVNCQNVFISRYVDKERKLNMQCQEKNKLEFSLNAIFKKDSNFFTGKINNFNPKKILDKEIINSLNFFNQKISINLNGNYSFLTDKNFKLSNVNYSSKNSNLIINKKFNAKLLSNNFDGNFYWNSKDNILKFNEILINNKLLSSGEIDLKEKVGFVNVSAQKLSIKNVKTHLKNHQNFYNQFINLDFYDSYNEKFRAGSLNDINLNLEYDFKQKFNLKKLSAELKFSNSRFADSNKIFKNIFATVSGSSSFNLKFKGNKIDVNESKITSDIVVSNGRVSLNSNLIINKKFNAKLLSNNFDGNFSWNSKDNILKFNEIFINNKLFSSGEIDLKEKVGFVNVSAQKLSIKNVKTHLKNHQNFYNQFINLDFYDSYNEKFRAGSLNDINLNIEYDFKQKFNLKKLSAELKFSNSRFADSNKIFKNIFATVSGSSSFNLKFKNNKIDVNESKISSDIVVSNGRASFNSNLIINEKFNEKLLSNNFDGNFSWNSKDNILKFDEIFINNKLLSSGEIDLKEKLGFVNVSAQKLSIKNVKTHLKNHQNFYNQFINLDFYESYNEKFRAGSLNDINLNIEYDFKQKFNLKKLSAELKFSNSRFADSNKIFKNIFATVSGSSSFNLKFKGNKINVNESKISSDIVVSNGRVSLNSNLILNEKFNGKLLSNNFYGNFSWNSEDNILKFDEIFINNKLLSSGEIDLKEKVGFVNVSAQKLSIKNVKTHLKNHQNFYNQFINLDFYESYNEKFRAGSLNDINLNLEYDFKQKFNLKKLSAELKFSNSRFADSNKIFKNIFATVSGSSSFNLKFKGNKIDVNESKISSDIVLSNGGVLFKEYASQFEFESGLIKANFDKGINNISEIKLHNKNNISYFFNDISFKNQNYKISKAALFKNKNIKYIFENTEIDKFNKIRAKVKIKNNDEISNYLKDKLNIELVGNATSNVTVEGDLNTFDFTLNLKSNLKNSFFNISSFGLEKQIGTSSTIQTEIIYKNSELKFLRNIDLEIERNKFKIGRVDFNNDPQRIILSKINTPNFDLNKILLTKNNQKVSLLIDGTKLNLSTFKNNYVKQ